MAPCQELTMSVHTPAHSPPAEEAGVSGAQSSTLDLLRAMAVCFVVVSHLPLAQDHANDFNIRFLGALGVAIFFVHTCLVLMRSLDRQVSCRAEDRWVIPFFLRRIFRIYPLSMVVVTVLAVLGWLGFPLRESLTLPEYFSNLFLIQNLTGHPSTPGPLWSLPFEIQMYLLLPLLFVAVMRGGKEQAHYISSAIWLAAVGLVLGAWVLGWDYHLIKFWPCFIPGVLAFSLRHRRHAIGPATLVWYVTVMAIAYPYAITHGGTQNLLTWPICLGLGLFIPHCRELTQPALRMVSHMMAKYSYSIYLLHVPCIHLAFESLSLLAGGLQWLTFLASLSGLTIAAHHLIEVPGIRLGQHLAGGYRTNGAGKSVAGTDEQDSIDGAGRLKQVA